MNKPALLLVSIVFLAAGSENPIRRLPEDRAGEVVRRSIERASGGWEEWAAKKTVQYKKTTIQFGADGGEERRSVQWHRYVLHPPLKVRIEEESEGRQIVLINNGRQAWKLVDGAIRSAQEDRNQAFNSTFGSHYVFCMPFKLTNPGARLDDQGRVELPGGGEADAVEVTYEPGAGSAAGMHTWTYYFDPEDGRLVANHLRYGPKPEENSYTEYADYQTVGGIDMPTRRYGYASNPRKERGSKTSEIFYEEIEFDVPLPDSLFVPPRQES